MEKKQQFITSIGGQALLEGIMMKGPEKTCLAVRQPDGEIFTETTETKASGKIKKIPFVRGAYNMVRSLIDGYNALMRSAEIAFGEDAEINEPGKFDAWLDRVFGEKAAKAVGVIGGVLGGLLAIVLFMVVPTLLTGLLARFMEMSGLVKAVVEAVIKILIFVLYLFLATRMKEIHRVFEYHGAEHKSIACYEHGDELTVENVRKYSRFHPRCGTSFLFIVVFLSILIFAFIPWGSTLVRVGLKLLALPLIMGIAYELLRYTGSHDNALSRIISAPGKLVQRLTAFEPDDGQIEVAIVALKNVIPEDGTDRR